MSQSERTMVKCQEVADGTSDAIVDLPPEMLAAIGITVGDQLSIELISGVIVLKALRDMTPEE